MSEKVSTIAAPVCSVCIANYNGAEVIEACLNSVFAQECHFSFEVIVHDDASSDGSKNIVRDRYPRVRLITSEDNVGFCISNNRMVLEANGKYILLLNNDATLWPNALRTLYEKAITSNSAILSLPQYDAKTGKLVDIGSLCDPFLNPIPNLDTERRSVAMVSGACLWVPRMVWEELGGFPAWFHTVAEDAYLSYMARLRGYPVESIACSGFNHHLGHSLGGGGIKDQRLSTNIRRRALSERNKSIVMALAYPAPLFQLIFPIHLVLLMAEGLTLALLKKEWRVFRDIYGACFHSLWRERLRLFQLRREVQACRKISLCAFLAPIKWVPHKLRLLLRHGTPQIN